MAQIIFLTLFLGVSSGMQDIALHADASVKSMRLELGGRVVAALDHAPWVARVDFGPELVPGELVAIGYDEQGNEIGRASQILNLPHPAAEAQIILENENGRPAFAQLVGTHRKHVAIQGAALSIDGKSVPVNSNRRAVLPSLDWSHPRVVAADVRFADGTLARREVVVHGGFADSVSSQLTPMLVTTESKRAPGNLDGCFSLDGSPLRASAVEQTNAIVILVKDPDADEVRNDLNPMMLRIPQWWRTSTVLRELRLDPNTSERILWPVAQHFAARGQPTYDLFDSTGDIPARDAGMTWLLTRGLMKPPDGPRRFADAVAVAGISALTRGTRRAVVLLLSNSPDASASAPGAVRRYLERIGVPLFVWSAKGPRPDLLDSWGEVEDISTSSKLKAAVGKLNRAIVSQRIAWIAVDPLASLRVQAGCGMTAVARAGPPPAASPVTP